MSAENTIQLAIAQHVLDHTARAAEVAREAHRIAVNRYVTTVIQGYFPQATNVVVRVEWGTHDGDHFIQASLDTLLIGPHGTGNEEANRLAYAAIEERITDHLALLAELEGCTSEATHRIHLEKLP